MNTNNLVEVRKSAANILKKMLDRKLIPKEAKDKWPSYKKDKILDIAFHALDHFEADEDIRLKDKKYAKWQTEQIQKIILCLETGEPIEKDIADWLTPRGV